MEELNTEIACIRLGTIHVIPITSPELACEFLHTHDSVFSSRPICMSASLISNGYLTSVFVPMGDQWMKMRRILASHVLTPTSFHWLRGKRDEEADNLHRSIYNQCKNHQSVINLRNLTRYYCGNVIRNMIFSKRLFDIIEKDCDEQVDALFTLLKYLHALSISDYLPWLSVFDLDGHKKIIKKAYVTATKHIDVEVDQRIQIWKDGNKTMEEDILDILITLKDTNGNTLLSVKEIKAQVMELMLATVDNPSNAVEWALAEKLNQPKLMQKAIKELNTVVGINRLPFNVPHVSISDAIIGEKYFIPKGSRVLLSHHGLGRNPRVWEDPLKFKPERHLIKEGGGEVVFTDSKLRLLSFSTGRRGCPGVKLGSTITTMLLARLLHGFAWSLPPNSSCNDLIESSKTDPFDTLPLLVKAKPRLAKVMYP
ncbi:hypothetical protein KY284_033218 [Solanum tuberosum]|nr:hypothetical protein KY284_033218 [Solanum tuberosum]